MEKKLKNISKLMSLVLRHQPECLDIVLDENGWTNVDELIKKVSVSGNEIDFELVEKIVETNDKKRFAFNEDKTRIRANQGHSVKVDLQLTSTMPLQTLYHGTTAEFAESILKQGLQKRKRHHVHLSENIETAKAVGSRRGKPIIFIVKAREMQDAGYKFYITENNVWLTDEVPARFITTR